MVIKKNVWLRKSKSPNARKTALKEKLVENESSLEKRFAENSVWNKGKKGTFRQTEETKIKISEANKGTNNYDWKGKNATHRAIHHWVEKWKGKSKQCENCGKIGEIVKGKWSIEWANIDHTYSRVLGDYIGMCKKCHGEYDVKNKLRKK